MPHVEVWTSGGLTHRVETYCQPLETAEDCLARHREAVAAAQAIWPPD